MTTDRRKQERFDLRLPVVLHKGAGSALIRTSTDNISNSGFYCLTEEPLSPGDRVRCLIVLPAEERAGQPPCYLEGDAEVIRLLVTEQGFAVGCRISDYHVIHDGVMPDWAAAARA